MHNSKLLEKQPVFLNHDKVAKASFLEAWEPHGPVDKTLFSVETPSHRVHCFAFSDYPETESFRNGKLLLSVIFFSFKVEGYVHPSHAHVHMCTGHLA